MTEHQQIRTEQDPAPRLSQARLFAFLGVLAVCGGLAAAGYVALCSTTPGPCSFGAEEQEQPPTVPTPAPASFEQWPRPSVALVLTGQMHGYVDPCGCSHPQYGGLVRRYNFIQSLKAKKWDVVGIDLGEIAALDGIKEQRLLKFDLSIKALATMNYRAFGIGKHEILNGVGFGLAQIYDKKQPHPRPIGLTLAQAAPGQDYHDHLNLRGWEIIGDVTPKIGVLSMMGPDFRDEFKQEKYRNNVGELQKALNAFADAGVEIGVILHHEYPKIDPDKLPKGVLPAAAVATERLKLARECAQFCAELRKTNPRIPPIQLMMVLVDDSEASTFLTPLDPALPTKVLEVGHKGTYVGLIGVYRDKGEIKLEHQNVKMTENWKSPEGKERDNPVVRLMEQYHQQLKNVNMLAQFPRTPHFNQLLGPNQVGLRSTYVGSQTCQECHQAAFKKWHDSNHSDATNVLEDATRIPVGRQFDPECMKCHTTGFKHPGGYNDFVANLAAWNGQLNPKINPVLNQKLRGVGCESCHGPCSEHVARPFDADLYKLINPHRPSTDERRAEEALKANPADQVAKGAFDRLNGRRMQNLNSFCTQCHDSENDVNWFNKGVAGHWKRIVHRTPAKGK